MRNIFYGLSKVSFVGFNEWAYSWLFGVLLLAVFALRKGMAEIIKIYIPDGSYDNQNYQKGLSELEASLKFKKELESRLQLSVRDADIGSGASFPSFLIELQEHSIILSGIGLFFLGEKINNNIEAWLSIGRKIAIFVKETGGYFNRSAAFLFGLVEMRKNIASEMEYIKLIGYKAVDGRFIIDLKNLEFSSDGVIDKDVSEQKIGGSVHCFKLEIDSQLYEMFVNKSEVRVKKIE
jgi:hypothetical protein